MRFGLSLSMVALPTLLTAQSAPNVLDPVRLRRTDRVLDAAVDSGRVGGVVALVLQDGRVAYQHAAGWIDREAGRRMTPNAIFRIASQSKAITSVAMLTLVEEGLASIDDPVSRYIPEFANTTVAVRSDSGRAIVAANRQITIRDLLTHTAGISYGTDALIAPLYQAKALGPAAGYGWYTADKPEPICTTMARLASLPFMAQPGERFVYGYNTDVLGCVVERVAKMPLDSVIAQRVTAPLRMRDTRFFVRPDDSLRLAAVYMTDSTNHAVRAPAGARGQGDYITGPRTSFSGGAGLTSTATDYARFVQMIANGGVLDGVRVLGPRTVALMNHNQVGTRFNASGDMGFGFGFQVVERVGGDGFAPVGTYGWAGAYATAYRVDPEDHLVIIFMTQMLPDRSGLGNAFLTSVYQALVPNRVTAFGQRKTADR